MRKQKGTLNAEAWILLMLVNFASEGRYKNPTISIACILQQRIV
jgi:hypothetical protein